MKTKLPSLPLSTALLSALFASIVAKAEAPTADYRDVLTVLQRSDSVLPQFPDANPVSLVYNREAIIPPQCYTRTEGQFNPCYVCHQDAVPGRENTMNDGDLQVAYSFSELGTRNHWRNLFQDRSEAIAAISDEAIDNWVATDNYSELPKRLQEAGFEGWIPDLRDLQHGADAFDDEGFAKDGSHWVAFNYKPVPSTFWPTNGAADDVMIRLPEAFRSTAAGDYSRDVYLANLAILEAQIKGLPSVTTPPVDEATVGADLDMDGKLGKARLIKRVDAYVGAAAAEFIDSYLYPAGTEFMHTLRYLQVSGDGDVQPAPRMKEVRYMRKWKAYRKPVYARYYQLEAFEKELEHLPGYRNLEHHGLDNGMGWSVHGFIEDRNGRLRNSSYEENMFCMGCHNSIGSTIDKTFSFARKVDGAAGWGYIDLKGMPDAPNRGEQDGEYLSYLARVGGGSEFRNNEEMFARWFDAEGQVDKSKVQQADVHTLITPSPRRARDLNKAYRTIVAEQSFLFGRDAVLEPPANVYEQVDQEQAPTLPEEFTYRWDIRLDWDDQPQSSAR